MIEMQTQELDKLRAALGNAANGVSDDDLIQQTCVVIDMLRNRATRLSKKVRRQLWRLDAIRAAMHGVPHESEMRLPPLWEWDDTAPDRAPNRRGERVLLAVNHQGGYSVELRHDDKGDFVEAGYAHPDAIQAVLDMRRAMKECEKQRALSAVTEQVEFRTIEPKLDDLECVVKVVVGMLADRHPGLMTWNELLHAKLTTLSELLGELGTPPQGQVSQAE